MLSVADIKWIMLKHFTYTNINVCNWRHASTCIESLLKLMLVLLHLIQLLDRVMSRFMSRRPRYTHTTCVFIVPQSMHHLVQDFVVISLLRFFFIIFYQHDLIWFSIKVWGKKIFVCGYFHTDSFMGISNSCHMVIRLALCNEI